MTSAPVTTRRGHIPGEAGIWVLILGDMAMFAAFFAAFLHARSSDPGTFSTSRLELNLDLGAINTLLLLTSSLLVAGGVSLLKSGERRPASRAFAAAGVCAVGFAIIKIIEYSTDLSRGLTPTTNDFFMYFYVLTGVHLAHLVIGTLLLMFMWRSARRDVAGTREQMFVECGASYWHMVDLLWIILFPLLYMVPTA